MINSSTQLNLNLPESEDEAFSSIQTTPVKVYHDTCDFGQYRLCYGVSDSNTIILPRTSTQVNLDDDLNFKILPIVESSVI